MGVPPNGWFIRENPIKMDDDWGYPHLWKPPYGFMKATCVLLEVMRIMTITYNQSLTNENNKIAVVLKPKFGVP